MALREGSGWDDPIYRHPRRSYLPTYHRPNTHRLESKETKNRNSRIQKKWSNAENFGLQERKQKQKSSHTSQIIKQKTR